MPSTCFDTLSAARPAVLAAVLAATLNIALTAGKRRLNEGCPLHGDVRRLQRCRLATRKGLRQLLRDL